MKNAFSTYHPIVNFTYLALVLIFAMWLNSPLCLAISLTISFFWSVWLGGRGALKNSLFFLLPMMVLTAVINPAFSHEGATILTYLPSGNPLTLESIIYGIAAAAMLANVFCWFSCYSRVLTSDKFVYLFGRIIPSLSLVLSMVLRFVPKFVEQIRRVSAAQRCIGRDASSGGIISRAKCGARIISIMVTWSLENAIDTADSMKSRGYGLKGRTAFSIYRFDGRDKKALFAICALGISVLAFAISGQLGFRYYPTVRSLGGELTPLAAAVYFVLCAFAPAIDVAEKIRIDRLEGAMLAEDRK